MDLAVRFCQELLPSLEDSVIFELKCLRCKELRHQPIFHCEKGHSFCSKCYKIGDKCKSCGSNSNGARTHHLERIFDTLTYPCKYFGKGCQKRCHPKKLNQHEGECQTLKIACPLRQNSNCTFVGTKKQIIFHCQLVHSHFTFVGETIFKQRILYKNFLHKINPLLRTSSENMIFQSFCLYSFNGALFQAMIQLKLHINVTVRMCRISPPSEMNDSYNFLISFYDFEDNILNSFHTQCCVSNGWQEPILTEDNNIQISFKSLKYCRYFTIEFRECS